MRVSSEVQLTTHGICSGDAIQAPLGVVVKGMVALIQAAALPQGSQALLVFSTACRSCNAEEVSRDCGPCTGLEVTQMDPKLFRAQET